MAVSRFLDPLAHVYLVAGPANLFPSESRVNGEVLRHFLVRAEPNFMQTEIQTVLLSLGDKRTTESQPGILRTNGDVLKQQEIGVRDKYQSADYLVLDLSDPYSVKLDRIGDPLGDRRKIVNSVGVDGVRKINARG